MDLEVYTVDNGLTVRAKDALRAQGQVRGNYHTFAVDVPYGGSSLQNACNLYEICTNYSNSSRPSSNTDAIGRMASWHLSIGKKDEPLDPWQLWEQVGFDIGCVEIITGRGGVRPWLLSLRRRGSVKVRVDDPAIKRYKEKVATTRRILHLSAPLPSVPTTPTSVQRSTKIASRRGSTDKPKKRKQSTSSSISSISGHPTGEEDSECRQPRLGK